MSEKPLAQSTQIVSRALPPDQEEVLGLLRLGKSVADAARSSNVGRSTVYHWIRRDPVFAAAYNAWHEEMHESGRSRLAMLTQVAIDALQASLLSGDSRAAIQVLKGMGFFGGRAERLTDPDELAERARLEQKKKRMELAREDRKIDLDDQVSRMMDNEVGEMVASNDSDALADEYARTLKGKNRRKTIVKRRLLPRDWGDDQ